jgi:hypothetical protein
MHPNCAEASQGPVHNGPKPALEQRQTKRRTSPGQNGCIPKLTTTTGTTQECGPTPRRLHTNVRLKTDGLKEARPESARIACIVAGRQSTGFGRGRLVEVGPKYDRLGGTSPKMLPLLPRCPLAVNGITKTWCHTPIAHLVRLFALRASLQHTAIHGLCVDYPQNIVHTTRFAGVRELTPTQTPCSPNHRTQPDLAGTI